MSTGLRRFATETVLLGPLIDAEDGKSPAVGLSIPASGILISKNGSALAPRVNQYMEK